MRREWRDGKPKCAKVFFFLRKARRGELLLLLGFFAQEMTRDKQKEAGETGTPDLEQDGHSLISDGIADSTASGVSACLESSRSSSFSSSLFLRREKKRNKRE